jgi:hypothetical protein
MEKQSGDGRGRKMTGRLASKVSTAQGREFSNGDQG